LLSSCPGAAFLASRTDATFVYVCLAYVSRSAPTPRDDRNSAARYYTVKYNSAKAHWPKFEPKRAEFPKLWLDRNAAVNVNNLTRDIVRLRQTKQQHAARGFLGAAASPQRNPIRRSSSAAFVIPTRCSRPATLTAVSPRISCVSRVSIQPNATALTLTPKGPILARTLGQSDQIRLLRKNIRLAGGAMGPGD